MNWYLRLSGGNPDNPEHYIKIVPGPPNCPGSGKICSVLACDNGEGRPQFTMDLLFEMITALNSGVDQTHVLLRFTD